MNTIDLQHQSVSRETLLKHTRNFSEPCVFINFPLDQKIAHCTTQDILNLSQKNFMSSTHNGSYWSDKPLYAEVQGRRKKLDLERMFLQNSGDYYVTYFQYLDSSELGWKTVRTCGNNEFDNFLASKTEFRDYMLGSTLHNHWVSNGNTLSSLHADPVDTLFLQLQGKKKFRLIPESLRISLFSDFRQPHKLRYSLPDLKGRGVNIAELEVKPGTAVFMPAWCFHEIESTESGLNISLTTHYPRSGRRFTPSPLQLINRARRVWYPRLVRKKRIAFQLENISQDAIPFFPWFSSFVTNDNFNLDTTFQHQKFLINRVNGKITPVASEYLVSILKFMDGYRTMKDISALTGSDTASLSDAVKQLIQDEFIQILFEAEDRYNYFYQSIEPKNINV